ncbi:cellulose biosynthesis protein BcsC [Vibrio aphrogenes]|uniref:cellulose biosynthesis protein BcsC n=1 Tax=Vibrio aphrogenes TaxID=1891186 RepID=UPI000B34BFF5|nr:cellulose biosynthesis protein BcsC [Vibrio aphrogenes]
MKNKQSQLLLAVLLGISVQALNVNHVQAAENDASIKILLDQANYWHNQHQDNLATESLKKVLTADANNVQALYLMSLWSEQNGDIQEAERWKARLKQVAPDSSQYQELATMSQIKSLSSGQLALARNQANSGNITASLATWHKLFNGETPPVGLAPEYYLTMAGDSTLYPTALEELTTLHQQYPDNTAIEVALGKVQTFKPETRRQGIERLQTLANSNKDADNGLRDALLWLAPKVTDEGYYQTWIQRHPQDNAVLIHYQNSVLGTVKTSGYQDLNQGNLAQAATQFQSVLKSNPSDVDALAGMGYVRYRQKNFAEAEQYLRRAAEQGGTAAVEYTQQANEAAFYRQLELAKQAAQSGDLNKALALSEPLARRSGSQGISAQLFRADVLAQKKNYPQAESTLKNVLRTEPRNAAANESLYYVLRAQGKTAEANKVLKNLPQSVQAKLQPRNNYQAIRDNATQALKNNHPEQAIAILQTGISTMPSNPWLRLDLARLYDAQGLDIEAKEVMSPLYSQPRNGAQSLYAAALFASDQNAWQQVQTFLNKIPRNQQTAEMKQLLQQAQFKEQLQVAERDIARGDKIQASIQLEGLTSSVVGQPAYAGELASMMVRAGDINSAVDVVNNSLSEGIKSSINQYNNHIAVLYQAGLTRESLALLNNSTFNKTSTQEALSDAHNLYVIRDAKAFSDKGQYATAYDKLIRALQRDPKDTQLMLAMARLYQAGNMNEEAGVVYDYLLPQDTASQEARIGAINVALAENDVERAKALSEGLNDKHSPENLLLLARISKADGNHQQALANLRIARGQLVGLENNTLTTSPMIGGQVLADNPFNSSYGKTMPWQVSSVSNSSLVSKSKTNERLDLPPESTQMSTLNQVNMMLDDLNDDTATWIQGGLSVRGRDGEDGLSNLTEAKAPLQWTTTAFDDWRLDINLVPISLNAGSTSGDASRRFGTGALIQGQVAQANGVSTLSGDTLPDVDSQGSQSVAGVELGFALTGYQFKFDLGTTPLGAEMNTLVGGIQWSPQITNHSKVIVKGERRAVTDSLLSYVGAHDEYSGKEWGQVTKNGASVQYSYDDGRAGFYAGGGIWSFLGTNVTSNNSVDFGAGVYFRPLSMDDREFKTGLSVNYMNFDKNLSYYSYGQGGYFSPQNYISIAFPQEYKQEFTNLDLVLGVSVGYQSYNEDSSAYFSNNSDLQAQLESYVAAGQAEEAYYSANSRDGLSYNWRAGLDYKINKKTRIEGRVSYDTFGDYNEYIAFLSFRHMLGGE